MLNRFAFVALPFAMLGCGPGCGGRPAPTAAGDGTDKLSPTITGYVVMDQPRGGIVALSLPSLEETVIRRAAPPEPEQTYFPVAHALSGPDQDGRIAFIDDYFFVKNKKEERHVLKTVGVDGQNETELFSRPGSIMGSIGQPIGEHLALSPVGGRVAFLSQITQVQMPSGLRMVGSLEIWDLNKKSGEKTGSQGLDEGLAWFPDGNRLAYVKLVDRKAIPVSDRYADALATAFPGDDKVPVVYTRDIATGDETIVFVGRHPVVSADGQAVLISDEKGRCTRVFVGTGQANAVTWHGSASPLWPRGGVVAWPLPDVVFSWCLPTEGTPVKHTTIGSPLKGPHQMLTLKLARFNTTEFQTIVPYIDPRTKASFGAVQKSEVK